MKKSILVLLFVLLVAFLPLYATTSVVSDLGTVNPSNPASVVATVYSADNYTGDKLNLTIGKFNKQMLGTKDINSIKIKTVNPVLITVYNSDHYQGQSLVITSDTAVMDDVFKWKVQSISIEWNKGFEPTPTPTIAPTPTPGGGGGGCPTPTPTPSPTVTPSPTPTEAPTPTPTPILPPTGGGGMDAKQNVANLLYLLGLLAVLVVAFAFLKPPQTPKI